MELSLKEYIKVGKSQKLDFVHSLYDSKKIAQIMCSFANSEGGSLFTGIKENGKISGVNPSEEIENAKEIGANLCEPKILFETLIWQEDFRLVLEIKIQPNSEKNTLTKDENNEWRKFIRINQHSLKENKILEKISILGKKNISKPEILSKTESDFFDLFTVDLKLSLSQLYAKSSFKKSEIDDLTAKFTYWKIIEMEFSNKGPLYKLKN
jgi:predicted HTH transcriptional regulator